MGSLEIVKLTKVGRGRVSNEDSYSDAYWEEVGDKLRLKVEVKTGDRVGVFSRDMEVYIMGNKLVVEREDTGYKRYFDLWDGVDRIKRYRILTLCDGMGGHAAGEVASHMGAYLFPRFVYVYLGRGEGIKVAMRRAVEVINGMVRKEGMEGGKSGMGTTLVSMVYTGGKVYMVNIGDSRGYIYRSGAIKRVTRDHSFVEELVRAGVIGEEEAFEHPQKNIITMAVGVSERVAPDVYEEQLEGGDVIMLCSDGLSDMLRDREIEEIMGRVGYKDMGRLLMEEALRRGGRDDITIILARIREGY